MSAWFVGTAHVNAMVTCAAISESYFEYPGGNHGPLKLHDRDPFLTMIGKALLAENIKSLANRYPSDYLTMLPDGFSLDAYTFQRDTWIESRPRVWVDAVNLCRCYDYQACEHDGWATSWAKRFTDDLTIVAAKKLAVGGDKETDWGYDGPPANAPRIIALSDLMPIRR